MRSKEIQIRLYLLFHLETQGNQKGTQTTRNQEKGTSVHTTGLTKERILFTLFRHNVHNRLTHSLSQMVNIAKMVSESWKTLPKEARVVWEEKAREDRLRYEAEKAAYNGPWKIKASTFSVQKDPSAPKKPMSAYLSYANKQRAMVKGMHPSATNGEVSKLLSSMWKGAPDSVRQIYINEEARLREIYHAEKAQWLEDKNRSIRNMRDPDETSLEEAEQDTVNAAVDVNKPAVHSMCIERAVSPVHPTNSCVTPPTSHLQFAPPVIDPQLQMEDIGFSLPSVQKDGCKLDVDFQKVFSDLIQDEEPIPATATSDANIMSSIVQGSILIETSDWGQCLRPSSGHADDDTSSSSSMDSDDTFTIEMLDNVATLLSNIEDIDDIFS